MKHHIVMFIQIMAMWTVMVQIQGVHVLHRLEEIVLPVTFKAA